MIIQILNQIIIRILIKTKLYYNFVYVNCIYTKYYLILMDLSIQIKYKCNENGHWITVQCKCEWHECATKEWGRQTMELNTSTPHRKMYDSEQTEIDQNLRTNWMQ